MTTPRAADGDAPAADVPINGCEDPSEWSSETGAELAGSIAHVTQGAASLRIRFTDAGDANAVTRAIARDWGGRRWLTFDVFVEATMPVAIGLWARDEAGAKIARTAVLAPGANTVSVDLEPGADEAALDRTRMASLCVHQWWAQRATLWMDHLRATPTPAPTPQADPARSLAAAYSPPPDFAEPGPYRSPLLRDDGTRVEDPARWPERRAEILRAWHAHLGAWPPLLDAPMVTTLSSERIDGVERRRIRVQVAPDRACDAWLLVPAGADRRRPAVLTVYYDADTPIGLKPTTSAFARELARRGFVALALGVEPRKNEANRDFYPDGIQPLSFLAYVAANCRAALAAMPEVDAARIGIAGHSYGGKWAMFASCLHEGFACAAWSDGGVMFDEQRGNANYWDACYLGFEPGRPRPHGPLTDASPRTGAYRALTAAGRDLHELHALMAPRPFLVSGGDVDPPERWRALNHAVAVNAFLGHRERVAMTNRPEHGLTREAMAQVVAFFARELRIDG